MIAATTMMEKIATWMSIAASDAMVKATLPVHPPSHQMFTALPPVATELSRTFVALTSSLVLSSTLTRSSTKLSSRSTKPRSSLVSLSLYGEYTCGRDTTRSKEGGRTTIHYGGARRRQATATDLVERPHIAARQSVDSAFGGRLQEDRLCVAQCRVGADLREQRGPVRLGRQRAIAPVVHCRHAGERAPVRAGRQLIRLGLD